MLLLLLLTPLSQYINNTGLMWNLGKKMGSLIVFAEHRFEGDSYPKMKGTRDCIAWGTTAQALSDYASLIAHLKVEYSAASAPVIAFGGSYGGMLTGWMRIAYPDVITGAIAASAPVRMIASADEQNYKGGWEAIGRGMSKAGGATDNCGRNFRSIHQLATYLGQTKHGLEVMNKAARRCKGSEFKSGEELLDWGGISCFFMAEGNYPFPSTYIPFSMGIDIPFPAWPTRVGCAAGLDKDLVKITGDEADVKYGCSCFFRLFLVQLAADTDLPLLLFTGTSCRLARSRSRLTGTRFRFRAIRRSSHPRRSTRLASLISSAAS